MVPFFHTLFTPFSHDFHTHRPSSDCNEISTLTVNYVRVISHHYVRHYTSDT